MSYRLGIDMGVNSLGWCALSPDSAGQPIGILDLGVRLYTDGRDPKKGTSLAVDRRVARGMRRRRDRYLLRRSDLLAALVRHGLMPADAAARKMLEALDPYEIRAHGLDEKLSLHEFGRALFHLNQRRGFRSNRKADKDESERGKIKQAISKLAQDMEAAGARTLGEYLHRRHAERQPIRARLRGEGMKAEYELYPQRVMLMSEFGALWTKQTEFHPQLTGAAREEIEGILFRQRPLRPVDPGKCALEPKDSRAPEALPLAQDFRIWQELANLKVVYPDFSTRSLTPEERGKIYVELERKPQLTFQRIRRILKLDSFLRFNLESEKRDRLKGHETNVALSKDGRFGKAWWAFEEDKRAAIVEALIGEADEATLLEKAQREWGLDPEAAEAVADARLPDGYCRVGRKALAKIVPIIRDQGLVYAEAAKEAGYHHSDFRREGELLPELPYYGEALDRHVAFGSGDPEDPEEDHYGCIPNPTVHIGLNQLRRLVNDCIRVHGRPAQIVVELARELKQSKKRKEEIQKEQAENQKKNDKRREKLAALGLPDTGENRLRLRLWEELAPEPHDRRCIYTGTPISINMLFNGQVDIDHILPFRLTLDDSAANKIVCLAGANRDKARRTPFEAFGHRSDWPEIQRRAENLPKNKRWRFAEDALERLKPMYREGLPAEAVADMELGDGFLARNLIDTQYLARLTREYLGHVCNPNQVWVVPGRLTAMLRGKWGLNDILSDSNVKNRADHRHHAVDAAVIGLTDRGMLQRIARANEQSRNRLIDDMPEPWAGFRDELREKVNGVVVSLRPDHGKGGRLHEETAYGLVRDPALEDGHNLVYRKLFVGLNENEVGRIRDRDLRGHVTAHLDSVKAANGGSLSAKELRQALADFATNDTLYASNGNGRSPIRRVRLLKVEEQVVPIEDRRSGKPYKALVPGENHHVDIYDQPDGSWVAEPVTVFAANAKMPPLRHRAHPAARRVMRLHKGDYIKLEPKPGEPEQIMRVVRLEQKAGRLRLAGHKEAGNLDQRHADKDDPFRWLFVAFTQLQTRKARKVHVDVLGRVRDPGPPEERPPA